MPDHAQRDSAAPDLLQEKGRVVGRHAAETVTRITGKNPGLDPGWSELLDGVESEGGAEKVRDETEVRTSLGRALDSFR